MSRRLPPAWVLVLFGLVLNVMAILMSSVVLDKLSNEINGLSEKKSENIYAIQLAWSHVETLERKREMLLLHLGQAETMDDSIAMVLRGQLSDWVNQPVPAIIQSNLASLMTLINRAQQLEREKIDDYYLHNLTIGEQMARLDHDIAWYKNVGLFLQIFGLVLILARDLARK